MKCKLSDICSFRKGKIETKELNEKNYISTENMILNKQGITNASSLPKVRTVNEFKKGDVLVSNIRPYFKKIWIAEYDGGCSNDILVFKANKGINNYFLYYLISDDAFFEYATVTAKGTKMPRGDKSSIMSFEVPDFDMGKQLKIASILKSIDDKIKVNNKINNNLEQQVSSIYKSWFEDFDLSNGTCPSNWVKGTFSTIIDISSGKRPPIKNELYSKETPFPIIGASSIMGYTSNSNNQDKILVIGRVGTHGIVQKLNRPCWPSDNTLIIKSPYYEFVNQILRKIDYSSLNRGSTQPLITQSDIKKIEILIPDQETIFKFEKIATTLMNLFEENSKENEKLSLLKDEILPKLISGEIDISSIKI